GETYLAGWLDAARDHVEEPAVAWGDLAYGFTSNDIGSLAVQADSGWAIGEVPGSENMFLTPVIVRDTNHDVWAAWERRSGGVLYTHTYCSAIVERLSAVGTGRQRDLSIVLSAAAP